MGQKIILLLDANPTIQKVVELAFSDTEYQIISLNVDLPSVEDTLEKVRNISPNMVLLDFDLPGMGGKDICKKLKGDPSLAHLPVILLVRELDRYSLEKLQEYGADRILGKPFEAYDLVRVVDECFNPAPTLEGFKGFSKSHLSMIPDMEKWLRQIVEEKIEEILHGRLEEVIIDQLEKFFQGDGFLRHFQAVFKGNENEIVQHVITNSKDVIENTVRKVVPEQAKIMIQWEIDQIKKGRQA